MRPLISNLSRHTSRLVLARQSCSARHISSLPNSSKFIVSPEIRDAVANRRGVVALESTVITHGLPFPENLEIAIEVENLVRSEGCVPATVAVINGRLHVGLEEKQLEHLSTYAGAMKVSRRDMAYCLAQKETGGTTVSGTMFAAAAANIRVFATGGVGGVHRGVEQTWDISADLTELGRTPVTVVCAGVKSILDVPKTLEYLETQGVPVIVFGPDNNFPGFYSRTSGAQAPYQSLSLENIAQMIYVQRQLSFKNGMLVACPIPVGNDAASQRKADEEDAKIRLAIDQALMECQKQGVSGQAISPYLLARVNELTKGKSLENNLLLLRNNARIAGKLARLLHGHSTSTEIGPLPDISHHHPFVVAAKSKVKSTTIKQDMSLTDVVVFGCSTVDFLVNADEPLDKADGTSYNGHTLQFCGGVGRNHADALTRLGVATQLVSAVGNDDNAVFLRRYCRHMDLRSVQTATNARTATYAAISVHGQMQYGVGDMNIASRITPKVVRENERVIGESKLVFMDGNLEVETIAAIANMCRNTETRLWFEPTDRRKLTKIFAADAFDAVYTISPNRVEMIELYNQLNVKCSLLEEWIQDPSKLSEENLSEWRTSPFIQKLMEQISVLALSLGKHGVVMCKRPKSGGDLLLTYVPAPDVRDDQIVSVSGAGDCFNAGLISGWLSGFSWEEQVQMARKCARLSLLSGHPVPDSLDRIHEE